MSDDPRDIYDSEDLDFTGTPYADALPSAMKLQDASKAVRDFIRSHIKRRREMGK